MTRCSGHLALVVLCFLVLVVNEGDSRIFFSMGWGAAGSKKVQEGFSGGYKLPWLKLIKPDLQVYRRKFYPDIADWDRTKHGSLRATKSQVSS